MVPIWELRLFDQSGYRVATFDEWPEFEVEIPINGPAAYALRLDGNDDRVALFEPDGLLEGWWCDPENGIDWHREFCAWCEDTERWTDKDGVRQFKSSGRGLEALLAWNIIDTYEGSAASRKAGKGEAVLKAYVDEQAGPGAGVRARTGLAVEATPPYEFSSVLLNGSNQYLAMPADDPDFKITGNVSIGAWVKWTNLPSSDQYIVSKYGAYSLWYYHAASQLVFSITGPTGTINTEVIVPDTTSLWHVVGTYDGTDAKLYINGAEVDTQARAGAITDTTMPLAVGDTGFFLVHRYWDGNINRPFVFDRALSPTEVLAMYEGGPEYMIEDANLVGYWEFAASDGRDSSGNDHTLTVYNSPTFQTDVQVGTFWSGQRSNRYVLEVCQEIAETTGVQFGIERIDRYAFEFRVWEPTDRQETVIFAETRGNMLEPHLTERRSEMANWLKPGGDGEGAARETDYVQDAASIAVSPQGRRERFVNAVGQTGTELTSRGQQDLAANRRKTALSFVVAQSPGCLYAKHYFLGDYVTALYDGVSYPNRIDSVKWRVTKDGAVVDVRAVEVAVESGS